MSTSTIIKVSFYQKFFSRLQLRIKKWFTPIKFLQILTTPCRMPLIREHLSLNASWYSYARKWKKKKKIEKLIWKKIQKILIVNNNNTIIRAWYLSSKWPVCRSVVNQTTGWASRTKLGTLLKIIVFKYCSLLCNKVANIHLQ